MSHVRLWFYSDEVTNTINENSQKRISLQNLQSYLDVFFTLNGRLVVSAYLVNPIGKRI